MTGLSIADLSRQIGSLTGQDITTDEGWSIVEANPAAKLSEIIRLISMGQNLTLEQAFRFVQLFCDLNGAIALSKEAPIDPKILKKDVNAIPVDPELNTIVLKTSTSRSDFEVVFSNHQSSGAGLAEYSPSQAICQHAVALARLAGFDLKSDAEDDIFQFQLALHFQSIRFSQEKSESLAKFICELRRGIAIEPYVRPGPQRVTGFIINTNAGHLHYVRSDSDCNVQFHRTESKYALYKSA